MYFFFRASFCNPSASWPLKLFVDVARDICSRTQGDTSLPSSLTMKNASHRNQIGNRGITERP